MTTENGLTTEKHFDYLVKAYGNVGDRTWLAEDFLESNLEASRNLFTPESLVSRHPRPKRLEVFALLSGLPFDPDFVDKFIESQQHLTTVIGESLNYWVAPSNLGVEYCVFKWPTELLNEEQLNVIMNKLKSIQHPTFEFTIKGIQINPDGCVIAKGFDEGGAIFKIREHLKAEIPFLPTKQSGWAHVPLGRILEPLGVEKFRNLSQLAESMSDFPTFTTEINSTKLIHETRWYMEEKTIVAQFPLANTFEEL